MTLIVLAALTAVSALLMLVVMGMQWANLRRIRGLEESLLESRKKQEALQRESNKTILTLGKALAAVDQRLGQTQRRQQDLENKDSGSLTYAQASKLIQMGAAPEDLVKSCGLSEAEAKLVSLMAARGVGRVS
ncbi:DUF2802 domain-containing protein [Pseudohongiella sp. SYSU M77423]|uniref:DUF2802 domain-containing protein n=1 Tax=Pseudohongiella sp. SYSU M77423 TaxID=3042312 RepID=UPI002480EEA1|nr:DUF2802 domain-containing protein [Pseudohongiella sp. SYSU M77423]MDH7942998.1 DUF2802 domain-containing protein [Pseudohongiella sp. SYSU M77423]